MKYRFEVVYRTEYMKKASELLKKLDLDIGDVGIKECFVFTSKNDVPVSEVKEQIKKAFESCYIELLHIEGGKIE